METKNADLNSLKINRSKEEYSSRSSTGKTRFIIWPAAILLIVIAAYFIIKPLLNPALEVNLTTAILKSPNEASAILTASGYVVAQRKASVASKGTGKLVYLGVVEGDKVKKDQIIARLEDNDIRAQHAQALANLKISEAELKEAEKSLHRQKELLKSGFTTDAEFELAESNHLRVLANIEYARATLLSAEVALENTLIRAPFDGTVLTKNADVGEIVAPFAASASSKAAVVMIADMKSLQVEADVSESNIVRITPGMECEITLDAYPEIRYAGTVAKIVPTADRSKATVLVKVGFKNYDSRVLPEMSAKVSFLTGKQDEGTSSDKAVLVIPASSVTIKEGKTIVLKVKNDVVDEEVIRTGKQIGEYIEVISGLSPGDRIIDKADNQLVEGTKVKVL